MRKLSMIAAGASVLVAGAAVAGTGHQWGNYLWGNVGESPTLNLRHKFSDATKAKWLPLYLTNSENAFDEWNSDPQSPLVMNDLGEAPEKNSATCDPSAGEILVCSDEYGNNTGWVGIAQIWPSGDRITRANAKMNDSFYEYDSFYDTPEQREFVVCHEVGHTFGLGHLDEGFYNTNLGSCMDYTANVMGPPDNSDPGQVDWDVLNSATMYGTGGGGTTDPAPCKGRGCNGGGGSGKPGKGNKLGGLVADPNASERGLARGRFGGVLGYDDEGRPNIFVKDLRGGKRITFVMWAKNYKPEGSKR
ncbi:hypothetical protein WJS89_05400 [Sphingomicrobium sp. XHP0235]|uniref:hypothetical protein n=1 Tax=Sphingomicrobium aquimarinum TaxID=3133971 RepID=UPI0031FF31F3